MKSIFLPHRVSSPGTCNKFNKQVYLYEKEPVVYSREIMAWSEEMGLETKASPFLQCVGILQAECS